MGDCPSDSFLLRYHAGELHESQEAWIRRHLALCEACARRDAKLVAAHQELQDRLRRMAAANRDQKGSPSPPASPMLHGETADLANGPVSVRRETPMSYPVIEGYEIVRELQRGGQGVVYQAIQSSTKRKVAIKVLLEGPYASQSARRRFEREIELVASLKHPNVISIFHSGRTPDGRQFCVMDYVRGVPIHQYVREQKLPLEQALDLFAKVCDAVNYAHQKGVIHRDLKPSNILVDSDGVPRVLDFGLAKMVGGPEPTLVSMTGQVVGTLPYMSPEQTRGNPDEIDIRTDVYALGVILYEVLTGHYPYPVAGQMAEVFKHIAETEPTPPSRAWKSDSGITQRSSRRLRAGECPIDQEVQTIALKALSKERQRRYQSAGELARDIGHYLAGEPIEARRDSGWYVLRTTLRRYRVPATIAAAFVVLVSGAALGLSIMYVNQSRARRDADSARLAEARHRHVAEEQRERADKKATEAEYQAFLANIAAAQLAFQTNEPAALRRRLDAVPTHLRNWEWGYLIARADTSLLTVGGEGAHVLEIVPTPYHLLVLTTSRFGYGRFWDPETADQVRSLGGCLQDALRAAFSLNGTRGVALVSDSSAVLLDASADQGCQSRRFGAERVGALDISPDGARVVTGHHDSSVTIWDFVTGDELVRLRPEMGPVTCARFSADGTRVVIATLYPGVTVWDTASGDQMLTLLAHNNSVYSAAFSSNGSQIVTGSNDRTARVFDTISGLELATLRGHAGGVWSAAFSPDGTRVVTGSEDCTGMLWDASTGQELCVLRGHTDEIYSAAFTLDGTRVVTVSRDGTAKLWDAAMGQELVTLRHHSSEAAAAAFSADGTRVLATSGGRTITVWDTATGQELHTLPLNRTHSLHSHVLCAAFSADAARLVTGLDNRTASIWDAKTGQELLTLRGHTERVVSAAFSLDGTRVITTSWDNTAKLWDARDGCELFTLRLDLTVPGTAINPDGTRLLTVPDIGPPSIWDAHSGTELVTFPVTWPLRTSRTSTAAFSPDGAWVVTASTDCTVKLWNIATGQEWLTLSGHTGLVSSAAFSPDSERLATASEDGTVKLWDAATGQELVTLCGHSGGARTAAFSPDGSRILTTSGDKTMRIWDSVPYRERYEERRLLTAARADRDAPTAQPTTTD